MSLYIVQCGVHAYFCVFFILLCCYDSGSSKTTGKPVINFHLITRVLDWLLFIILATSCFGGSWKLVITELYYLPECRYVVKYNENIVQYIWKCTVKVYWGYNLGVFAGIFSSCSFKFLCIWLFLYYMYKYRRSLSGWFYN